MALRATIEGRVSNSKKVAYKLTSFDSFKLTSRESGEGIKISARQKQEPFVQIVVCKELIAGGQLYL